MKGQRTKPRVDCERGRVAETRTEYRKKQKGALNMNVAAKRAGRRTEMRNSTAKERKKRNLGKICRVLTHPHEPCILITKHQLSTLNFLRDLSDLEFSWEVF